MSNKARSESGSGQVLLYLCCCFLLISASSFGIFLSTIRLQKVKQKPLFEKRHIRYWKWLIGEIVSWLAHYQARALH